MIPIRRGLLRPEIIIEINISLEKFSDSPNSELRFWEGIILENLLFLVKRFYYFEDGDYLSTSFCLLAEKAIPKIVFDPSMPETMLSR